MPHTVIVTILTHQPLAPPELEKDVIVWSPFFVSELLNLKLKQQQPEEFVMYCVNTCVLYLHPPVTRIQTCIASILLREKWEMQEKGKQVIYHSRQFLHQDNSSLQS